MLRCTRIFVILQKITVNFSWWSTMVHRDPRGMNPNFPTHDPVILILEFPWSHDLKTKIATIPWSENQNSHDPMVMIPTNTKDHMTLYSNFIKMPWSHDPNLGKCYDPMILILRNAKIPWTYDPWAQNLQNSKQLKRPMIPSTEPLGKVL